MRWCCEDLICFAWICLKACLNKLPKCVACLHVSVCILMNLTCDTRYTPALQTKTKNVCATSNFNYI